MVSITTKLWIRHMGTEWRALHSTRSQYQGIANTIVQLIGFIRFGLMAGALGERVVF